MLRHGGSYGVLGSRLAWMAVALTALVGLSLTALAAAPQAGKLEVVVTGLESDEGQLMIALLDSAEMFDAGDRTFRQAMVKIEGGRGSTIFEGVPYGTYAIKTFHDENSNDELDTNFVGYPKEGFGFSNDAMGKFGPPSFDEASFEIDSAQKRVEIKTKN